MSAKESMASKKPELPNIFEYLDYRLYLKAVIEVLRSANLYSIRTFANRVGFKSSSYMKRILDGERNLTDTTIQKIISGFELTKTEGMFLKRLVDFNQAATSEERDRRFQDLLKFKRFQRLRPVEASQYEYYSRWYTSALFVALGTSWNKKTLNQMATSLGISTDEVSSGLRILQQLNLIEREGATFKSKEIVLESSAETNSLNVRNFHREMLQRGLVSLDLVPPNERDVQALTLALSPENFNDLKKRIAQFRQEISLLYAEETNPKVLYQLHFLFFPLLNLED